MIDAVEELKTRARLLHRRAQAGEADALGRIGALPEFARTPPAPDQVQRKHGLAAIARELGFRSWAHATRVLAGDHDETDLGTLLYPRTCGFTNQWFAQYEQARRTRELTSGYLLGYRHQYLVVTRHYVEALGLDPDDPDWEAMGFDWVRPLKPAARQRMYAKLVAGRPREAA